MSGAIEALRREAVEQLRRAGLNAVAAMEPARAGRWREPVAAVSLRRVACTSGGFMDYLGVRADPDTGEERELYGREAELTFGIDVFAPRDGGGAACQLAAEKAAEAILRQGLAGLNALELTAGEVEFLQQEGLYRLQCACRCRAWLVAEADGGGAFVDIEVKGRLK